MEQYVGRNDENLMSVPRGRKSLILYLGTITIACNLLTI